MIDPNKTIDKALGAVDDNVFSEQERQTMLTERQKIDMTSPFMLPQLIRPILALWGAATYSAAQAYCLYKGLVTGLEVMTANGALVVTIIGFYFNSRKMEKMNAKKYEADIKRAEIAGNIEEKKELHRLREERKDKRAARRAERRLEREQQP